jgi:glycosyltransferase involved in cell wall biosynthesis
VKDFLATATVTLSAWTWTHRSRFGLSPVKLAEYMACGRAIVTTDLPGLTEMIEETEVGVVTSADPQPLSGAIIALLEDPKRADELGANGRRKAEESYSWRSIVRRTLPLFGI